MKKGLALLLCVGLALTALAGCSGKTKEMQKVTVCEVTHSIFYAPQYVALAKGFFADEGLDVELSNGGGADKVMSAVLSGNVDIGFAGPEASIYVYNEGKEDYTEVFAQVTKCDGSFLVGREKDDSFTWDKLAGKHILPEGAAEAAKTQPPATRATQRSRFINAAVAAGEQFTVDWVHLKLNAYPQHTLVCKDPFATDSEGLQEVLTLLEGKARQHREAAFPPPC